MADHQLTLQVEDAVGKMKQVPQVLAFSCGADSLASLIRMIDWGITPKALIYYYFIPDLPMIENYLRYIEDKTGICIYRFPSAISMQYYINGLLQFPGVGQCVYEELAKYYEVPKTSEINDYIMESFPSNSYMAIGLRVSDGIFRAKLLREKGPIAVNRNEWYPVADCYRSDIVSMIEKSGFRLPIDYCLFGRSFESIRHWTAPPIKEHCPKTWLKILEYFPMANLLCGQDSLIKKSREIQSRITSYAHLSFKNEEAVE